MFDKQGMMITGGLVVLTALSGVLLTNPMVSAEESFIDSMSVSVPMSCSLTSVGTNSHSGQINNGQTVENIGTTTVKIFCNDNSGWALYAIGYTDDEYGKNVLVNSALSNSFDIATAATVTTGTSSWAMKLAATSGTYAPTIVTNFASYAAVPTEYTKVAYYPSSTDLGTSAIGSNLTTTYRAYISPTQPAGTYVGQVKYVLVHPNTAAAPLQTYTMQDVASWKSKIATNQEIKVIDSRDGKEYTAAKLADGNIWMTQNLDHDIDSTYNYNSSNTDVPSNWSDTLTSTYATNNTTWYGSYNTPESYDPGDLCWNGTFAPDIGGTLSTYVEACGNDKHYHIGNYYNWTAAVAMADTSSYNDTDVNQSICPAGWMLPKGGTSYTSSGSFSYLVNQLSLTSGTSGNAHTSPVYFVYGGVWTGGWFGVGGYAIYWSSVAQDTEESYILYLDRGNSMAMTDHPNFYIQGSPVRCVAR